MGENSETYKFQKAREKHFKKCFKLKGSKNSEILKVRNGLVSQKHKNADIKIKLKEFKGRKINDKRRTYVKKPITL